MSVNLGEIAAKTEDGDVVAVDIEASQLRDEVRIGEYVFCTNEAWALYLLLKAAVEYNGVDP